MDEYPDLNENFRNMDISSFTWERVPPQLSYSNPPQPRYPHTVQHMPSHPSEFEIPAYERLPLSHTHYRQGYYEPPPTPEKTYRGPAPTTPFLTSPDPKEFSRLRIALDNILSEDATEYFKFQILTDHLKLEEAFLVTTHTATQGFLSHTPWEPSIRYTDSPIS